MRARSLRSVLWLILAISALLGAAPARNDDAQKALGSLLRRLRATGRAEAAFQRSGVDALSGQSRVTRGRIALEPPDRADIRFLPGGERIALRGDGGEWIQPELKQLLRLGPENAASARQWSRYLLTEQGARLAVRRLAPRQYLVVVPGEDGQAADSARVWLDAAGLPTRLEIRETDDQQTTYRFSGWRFRRPLGRSAFVIPLPPGYEAVPLP